MNGAKSKLMRLSVYKKDGAYRHRIYKQINQQRHAEKVSTKQRDSLIEKGYKVITEAIGSFVQYFTYTQVADPQRQAYQNLKKHYLAVPRSQRHNVKA